MGVLPLLRYQRGKLGPQGGFQCRRSPRRRAGEKRLANRERHLRVVRDRAGGQLEGAFAHDVDRRADREPGIVGLLQPVELVGGPERIADRATNIAESVVYLVTGTPGELKVSRY